MNSEEEFLAAAQVILCLMEDEIDSSSEEELKICRKRRVWVKPSLQRRPYHNLENKLIADLLNDGESSFKNFCRLNVETFEILHSMIENEIKKGETQMRETISSRVRLATTLRYVASGCSQKSLEFLTRISRSTISLFIPEVVKAIYANLMNEYLKIPQSEQEWRNIAKEFEQILHFPHVLGAIDGKHIYIESPPNTGSYFFNYKGRFSIVLLAMVDARGNFIYVDVRCQGRISDGGVFKNSSIYKKLNEGSLNIPKEEALPGRSNPVPYMIVGDDAFALSTHILKRFSKAATVEPKQKIFNYRLSYTRNIVERSFGRLVSRFRIFKRPIDLKVETTEHIVLACCALHNFLNAHKINSEVNGTLPNMHFEGSNHSSKAALDIRNEFADYFMNEGAVDFQWKIL